MTKKINILYEDANILAIDKPAGISVHPSNFLRASVEGKDKEKFITDWILKNYPKMENVGEPSVYEGKVIKRPGIVHRLDKDTSGVLLLAKNQKAYEFLKSQFKNREIKKIYHCLVSGFVKEDRGTVNKPIGRSPNDFRKHLAGRGARGELREAITEYKVIKRLTLPLAPSLIKEGEASPDNGELVNSELGRRLEGFNEAKFTYLELTPKTGRTHQIRVHMKFLNHPVVCDSLYNPGKPALLGIDRLALHAKSIEFKDLKGKTVKVESPLPKEFLEVTK